MCFIYFILCVLLPICIPVPEAAVVLWGTDHIGSLQAFLLGVPMHLRRERYSRSG